MTNIITNVIYNFTVEDRKNFCDQNGSFDFNTIKPMPEKLNVFTHSGVEMWVEICTGQINFSQISEPKKTVKDFSEKDFNDFIQCLKNYRKYGAKSWYEWRIANWGIKSNTRENHYDGNTLKFKSASDTPKLIWQEIAKKYPKINWVIKFADEDWGCNTGIITIKNGICNVNYFENQSKEAFENCFEVLPHVKEYYTSIKN